MHRNVVIYYDFYLFHIITFHISKSNLSLIVLGRKRDETNG